MRIGPNDVEFLFNNQRRGKNEYENNIGGHQLTQRLHITAVNIARKVSHVWQSRTVKHIRRP